jgi:hypothetical protein
MHILPLLLLAVVAPTESWEYPNSSGKAATTANIDGRVVATSFTNEYDYSFDRVATWYAKRTKFDSLTTAIVAYRKRAPGDADFSAGTADAMKIDGSDVSNGTALFNFSPQHMHAMIVLTDKETGDIISISIAGNNRFTTVNFVRRPQPPKSAG